MSQAQRKRVGTQPRSKATATAVKGRNQKEFSIPALKVCTLRWTFLHDLGQLTEAKPKLLDQGGLGSLMCPTGHTESDPSLLSSFQ